MNQVSHKQRTIASLADFKLHDHPTIAAFNLCELHAEECDLCHETYGSVCFLFHLDQPHAKPNAGANQVDQSERRRA